MAFSKRRNSKDKSGICLLVADNDMSIYSAAQNHADLIEHYANFDSFEIDLSEVEEIDCSGVQLLLALKQNIAADGKNLMFTKVSPAIAEVMSLLNINEQFNFSGGKGA